MSTSSLIEIVGLLRARGGCCLFTWKEFRIRAGEPGDKTVEVEPGHCALCIEALQDLAPDVRLVYRNEPESVRLADERRPVLVVDDDADICDALGSALADFGRDVVFARNGQEALDRLRSQNPLPAVIILDLMMPVMDGYKFRQEQAKDESLAKIPIVVITANREAAPLPGVTTIRKPFKAAAIAELVARPIERL